MTDNLWTFNYKKGSAPHQGVVRAADEVEAYEVMRAWCVSRLIAPAAKVFPMILADASILSAETLAKIDEVRRKAKDSEEAALEVATAPPVATGILSQASQAIGKVIGK